MPSPTQLILKPQNVIAETAVTTKGTGKLASLGYDIIFRDNNDVKRVLSSQKPNITTSVYSCVRASELERLLAKLSPTMKLIVELAYETAMRRSEILKLTKDCLHTQNALPT